MVKLFSQADPSREPIQLIKEIAALDKLEELYGLIATNNGTDEKKNIHIHVGLTQKTIDLQLRQRKLKP